MKKRKEPIPERLPLPDVTVDPDLGLTAQELETRLRGGWSNDTRVSASRSEREIILKNTLTFFNLIFIVLAVLLAIGGSSVKNMTFLVVALCNTVIGCFQEIRAKRAVDKLNLVAAQMIPAVRDGTVLSVRSDRLVRDDIVEFGPGDQICADAVVRRGQLQVNESLVTGEADPVVKNPGDSLLSGSFVITGRARVQLTQVGADSFASKLAAEAKANPHATKSEMMRSLDKLIRVVGFALIPVGAILLWQEYQVLQLGLRQSVEGTVAALVGMIPEGLYLLTSVAMAVSSMKLAKQRVLVQDLNCIETLARVDVLCVDKTGTITEPAMEVEDVVPLGEDTPEYLEDVLSALYAGESDNETGRAMGEMFANDPGWECRRRIPFTSATKWSGAVFAREGAFLVGAPEMLLQERYEEYRQAVEDASAQGCRVLLCGAYDGDPQPGALDSEKLRPMALILLTNRIRPAAPKTFAYFAAQGVAVRVISGDNPVTVSAIAQRAGIPGAENYVDARELRTDEAIAAAAETYTVFGRVTPDQKKKLVQAMQAAGHTVAMTGDGVNDVLAMKSANCGIAMASGAQAASQVAQLVLLDSDFAAMPDIVGEGRRVINNIQRSATLFLVKNIFSLGLSLISLFTNLPYPIVPLHLSVISGLTIGLPSFLLAMEPNYERVKGRFLTGVLRRAFPGGLTNIFVVLAAQLYMLIFELPLAGISSVCASLLAIVGLLVLFQTCKPFDRYRKLIWGLSAVALLGCFTLLGRFFSLEPGSPQSGLVMATLLIMTPTVFFAIQRVFDWGDRVYLWFRRKLHKEEEPD